MLGHVSALIQKPVPWAVLRKSEHWIHGPTLPAPQAPTQSRSWNLGFFSPAYSVLGQEEGLCWVIVQTATSVLSHPGVQSALWDRWDRSQWLRLHPGKKIRILDVWSSSFLLFPGRSWEFSPNHMALCQGWWLRQEGISNFPTNSDMAGFTHTWGAEASQLVSGFLTKGTGLCITDLVCLLKKGGSRACYSAILLTSLLPNIIFKGCIK